MKNTSSYPKFVIWLTMLSLWSINAKGFEITPVMPLVQTDRIVFAVIGDYGLAGQNEADVANLVKSWSPDFIVTVGDNNYPNGASSTIDENIGQYYHDFIYPYRGKFGAGAAYKRFFPVLGNHDWNSNEAKPYFSYFSFYNEIGYYDFIKGPTHFFMLDSDPQEPDGTSSTSEQAKWLKRGLAASTSDFNIVVTHHAPYSSGKHGSTTYMQWPYKLWGADAVLSGHDHLYERLFVDGLPYFVNGIGGAELYPYDMILSESQIRFNQDYGAMRVEVNSLSMKFQFFTRTGILIDEYTMSKTIPIVTSIARLNASPSNATTLDFLVTFSESVTGVDASDFTLSTSNIDGAFINAVSGSENAYNVTVISGPGNGSMRLDLIDNDSITNGSGNKLGGTGAFNGTYLNGEVYETDKSAPSVSTILRLNPNPTNSASVDFQISFTEPVTGVDAADFFLKSNNGASITAINGSGNTYTVSASTGPQNDILGLDFLDNDSVMDPAGNTVAGAGNGNFTTGESYTVDRLPPAATSIIRAGTNPSNAPTVDFIVSFTESVNGVDSADFILTTENINDAFVSAIHNSGPFHIVTVHTGSGAGTIRLDLADNDSIMDPAGNQLGNAGIGNGAFVNGEIYRIEKTAPIVNSITRGNPNPSNSPLIDWIVTFSDNVAGVDISDFSLINSTIPDASIISVNGSGNRYSVSVGTGSGDGTLRLDLIDNDSITSTSAGPLGNTGLNNGSFTNSEAYTMDKTAPIVTSIIRAGPNPYSAATIDYIVTFSELVTGVDPSDFSLDSGNISGAAIGSITNANPFYVVTVNSGAGTGSIRLDLSDDESIFDTAGNSLGGPGSGNGNFSNGEIYSVEKSFPHVTSISRSGPSPTGASSVDFIVTFSESVTGIDPTDFNLNGMNIINASVLGVTNADPFYIIKVSSGIGTGEIRLDLIDDDSIVNISGSQLGGPGNGNGNFVNGETFQVSKNSVNFPAPTLREPRQNFLTSNASPTFSWELVRGASAYEIVFASDSNFTQNVTSQTVTGPPYTSTLSLIENGYFWRVRAYNSTYQPGKFSPTYKFTIDTTPPPTPVLLSPADTATTTKTNFIWGKISGAAKYQVEIDADSDFSSPEWSSLRNTPTYQISNMHRGTYFWRVRARDLAGNWSPWSMPFTIRFP